MSHYTFQSGIQSIRITSRCPVCLCITEHANNEQLLTDESICCGQEHRLMYHTRLMVLYKTAQAWAMDKELWHLVYDASKLIDTFLSEFGTVANSKQH